MLQWVSDSVVCAGRSFFHTYDFERQCKGTRGNALNRHNFSSAPRAVSRSAVVAKELPRRQDLRKVLCEIEEDGVRQSVNVVDGNCERYFMGIHHDTSGAS